ncbi:MAG: ABC transporter ATP-binding protein/permease, partial [Rikenellaceae bacterium]|nr:ABC transporter ATP-binding protein/permease [Rikenellaceae bacterium]
PYFFYILLHTLFNTLLFWLIIPMLNTLFEGEGVLMAVREMPRFTGVSIDYFNQLINFILYKAFGETYNIRQMLLMVSVVIVAVTLLSNAFRYLAQRTMETLRINTLRNLRNDVFDNVTTLHVGFFGNERKGDIISKITSDVQVVQFCITNTLQAAFRDPLLIAGYLIILLATSWELTLFSVLVLPVSALLIGAIVKRLRASAKAAQESFGDMVSLTDESLGGIKTIKGYNASNYVARKFRQLNDRFSTISRKMAYRQQMASPVSEFLGIATMAVILVYGGGMVVTGKLSSAEFIAYLGVFSQITRPARSLADAFANIHQGIAAGERVLGLIDTKPQIVDSPDAVKLETFESSIEFRDVSFSYEEREILHNISFTVQKGETVALVGPSGGGKSTISDLIPRFYDVQQGEILIDGRDLRAYNIESVRDHMGIVAQETILFNDTIENNIRLGKLDATHDEVVHAAWIANADNFIREADQGYETNTGDRGMKLSGGQRQRLSIARAVLKNPDILILDEATSALDTESEKLVQEALNNLLAGRTSLVIAHRLSTIQHADKIIVIEQGRIVEEGTHQQLMALDGVYRKLIEMQQLSNS